MAGMGTTSSLGTASLSPQMLQAIQQAANTETNATGQSDAQIASTIMNSLSNSGLFTPQELSAANSAFGQGSGTWGSAPGATSAWDANVTNAMNGVLQNQNSVSANQQTPNAAVAAGYNPLQPAYLSQPATLNASTLSPSLINSLGSGQTISALQGANAPAMNQQDQQMMQMLATAGLAPSSTAGQTAFNNLAQQQLAGMDPSIASAIQNSQSNVLGANTTNMNALNTAGQVNLGNQLQQQEYNANAYNTAGNNYFNAMTGAYNNNANAFNALNSAGLSGVQGLAETQAQGGNQLANSTVNTFPNYGSNSTAYGALGQGLGGYSPTGTNYGSAGTYNPYADQAAGGGNALTPGAGANGEVISQGWGDYG